MESFLADIKSLINDFCSNIDNKYIKRNRKISGSIFFSLLNRFGYNKSYNLIISHKHLNTNFNNLMYKFKYKTIYILINIIGVNYPLNIINNRFNLISRRIKYDKWDIKFI